MNIKIKVFHKVFRCFFLFLILSLTSIWKQESLTVKAISATLTFSAESREVQIGETFSVVVYLDSSNTIGGFEGYLSYDENLADFIKGGSHVSGGDGYLKISDLNSDENSKSRKYSITFQAKEKGSCNFGTSEPPKVYNESGEELSISSNRLSISILSSTKLSTNQQLRRLKISPGQLIPEYNNDVMKYETEIPYESDMLFISAEAKDDQSVVSVQGNENLKEGLNFVHVIVTAPSGDIRDIQIAVKRQYKSEQQDKEERKEENIEKKGIIVTPDGAQFSIFNTYDYKTAVLSDKELIPSGYVESEVKIDKQKIPAYISTSYPESEFVFLYLTNAADEKGFYWYDRVEHTILRYHNEKFNNPVTKQPVDDKTINDDQFIFMVGVIIILGVVIVLLSAMLAIVVMKHKKKADSLQL